MTYLDNGTMMRLIEGHNALRSLIVGQLQPRRSVTSVLAITECLHKPLIENNQDLSQVFRRFFNSLDLKQSIRIGKLRPTERCFGCSLR